MTKLPPHDLLVAQTHVLYQRAAMIDDDVAALRQAGLKEAADDRGINRDAAVSDFWQAFKKMADADPTIWERLSEAADLHIWNYVTQGNPKTHTTQEDMDNRPRDRSIEAEQ
jgi:hypothetical protein